MRSTPIFNLAALAVFLFSGVGTVNAAEPTLLALDSGFLLGNAYRCGVSIERVRRAEKIIYGFIRAAASSPTEQATADARFAEGFAAGAYPTALIPACNVVVAQFDKLERHHRQTGLD